MQKRSVRGFVQIVLNDFAQERHFQTFSSKNCLIILLMKQRAFFIFVNLSWYFPSKFNYFGLHSKSFMIPLTSLLLASDSLKSFPEKPFIFNNRRLFCVSLCSPYPRYHSQKICLYMIYYVFPSFICNAINHMLLKFCVLT